MKTRLTTTDLGIIVNGSCGAGSPGGKGFQKGNTCATGTGSNKSFQRWFKNSKVVDEDGSPLIVYHGTGYEGEIYEFRGGVDQYSTLDEMLGAHFADNPGVASTFTHDFEGVKRHGRIYPVYLSIQNPREVNQRILRNGNLEHDAYAINRDIRNLVLSDDEDLFVSFVRKQRRLDEADAVELYHYLKDWEPGDDPVTSSDFNGLVSHDPGLHPDESPIAGFYANYDSGLISFSKEQRQDVVDRYKAKLKELGHDGIVYTNTAPMEQAEGSMRAWIAFDARQVKSAYNLGTYDPENPNLLNALVYNDSCGAGSPGGAGFSKGNTCAAGGSSSSSRKKRPIIGEKTKSGKTKSELAKLHSKLTDADVQQYSEENNEPILAEALGGKELPDCEPIDVLVEVDGELHGIELKTLVDNDNMKLTVKPDAGANKRAWERKNKAPVHTVVYDDQLVKDAFGPGKHDPSKRRIYYRRGWGSWRINNMHLVKDESEILELIKTPVHELPRWAGRQRKKPVRRRRR